MNRYSDALEHLYAVARSRYRTVRIHVCSDHGMAPTKNIIDVRSRLARLKARAPDDYLCLLDSTMARFWFFSDKARSEVMEIFSERDRGEWLSEYSLRRLHAFFDDHRYGEEIYLMPEGTVIAPSHMGVRAPRGMHGFHPLSQHSFTAFLSSEDYGDGVRHISDVFSVMSAYAN